MYPISPLSPHYRPPMMLAKAPIRFPMPQNMPCAADPSRLQSLRAEFLSPQVAIAQNAQPATAQEKQNEDDEITILSCTLSPRVSSNSSSSSSSSSPNSSAAAVALVPRSPSYSPGIADASYISSRLAHPRPIGTALTTASYLLHSGALAPIPPTPSPKGGIKRPTPCTVSKEQQPPKKIRSEGENLFLLVQAAESVQASPRISFDITLKWLDQMEYALLAGSSPEVLKALIDEMPSAPVGEFFDEECEALQTLFFLIKTMVKMPPNKTSKDVKKNLLKDPAFRTTVLIPKGYSGHKVRALINMAYFTLPIHDDALILINKARDIEAKLREFKKIQVN